MATTTTRPPTEGTAVSPATRPLRPSREDVLREIQRDSNEEPAKYVEQAVVPFGGE